LERIVTVLAEALVGRLPAGPDDFENGFSPAR